MPNSQENEIAVLGSILLNAKSLDNVVDILTPDSFHDHRNCTIYKAIVDMYNTGKDIDLITLKNELEEKKVLAACGGISYLTSISTFSGTSTNIKTYADKLVQKHVQRKAIQTGEVLKELGNDGSLSSEDVIDSSEREVMKLGTLLTKNNFQHVKQILSGFSLEQTELEKGVNTPFNTLTKMLSGLQRSDLIILAGRPSMGKTTLAFDFVKKACIEDNIPVGVFSLEMSNDQLINRLLASHSGVDGWKIKNRVINSEEKGKVVSSIEAINKAPLYIDDNPAHKIASIRSGARRLKKEHGIRLLVIDYLQLITPSKSSDSTVQQITEISRSLKLIAKELQIPVIALSQLSRAVEQRGGNPRLSDLRDSGSIEQDADVVMFVHNQSKYSEEKSDLTDLIVAKHRNGAVGEVQLLFKPSLTTFIEVDKSGFKAF